MHVTNNTVHTFIYLTHINVIAGAILLALPAGIAYDFVGEFDDLAYGRDGTVDLAFDPHHHGLAGFGNAGILSGPRGSRPSRLADAWRRRACAG